MSNGSHLNLGAGDFPAPQPWINVDTNTTRCKPQIAATINQLPFADQTASRIYAGHVLEHILILDIIPALQELARVLRDDGTLMIVGPDVKRAFPMYCDGQITRDEYDQMLLGGHRWPGDEHAWPCVGEVVDQFMQAAGYQTQPLNIRDLEHTDWPVVSYIDYQFAVQGTKP